MGDTRMSVQEFDAHPIRATLSLLLEAKNWSDLSGHLTTEGDIWHWQKVLTFIATVDTALQAAPSHMVSIGGLGTLDSTLRNVLNELNAWRANKNPGHLVNAVSHIDGGGINQLWVFGQAARTKTDKRLLADVAGHASLVIQSLSKEKQSLENHISELSRQTEVMTESLRQLTEKVSAEQAKVGVVTDEVRNKYEKTDIELREIFRLLIEEKKNEASALLGDTQAQFKLLNTELSGSAANLISDLNLKKEQAGTIVQIVGNIGVTGNYQKTAIEESSQANTWRFITLGVFAIAIVIGWGALLDLTKAPNAWGLALVRMVFAVIVATTAVYTGRESARHRTNADAARRTELELASLGPYLESVSVDKRESLREKLAERYFGNQTQPHIVDPVVSTKDAFALAEKAFDVAKNAVK
jgi:hypothetical protein